MMTLTPKDALKNIDWFMKNKSSLRNTSRWQAQSVNQTLVELTHVSFRMGMIWHTVEHWQQSLQPNLPWAEEHFQERVCGVAINPGTTYKNWPWASKAEDSMENGQFNHNYMERLWPKFASTIPTYTPDDFEVAMVENNLTPMTGLRHEYGDLGEVIQHLAENPDTRQAYLPLWFPEDSSYANAGRKPCTLGYHFYLVDGCLDLTYPIRSCDYYRHFKDDVYLAVRLALYVLQSCKQIAPSTWENVRLGDLIMNITSLHMFLPDYQLMYGQQHPKHRGTI